MIKGMIFLALAFFSFGAGIGLGHPFYGALLCAMFAGIGHAVVSE